MARLEHNVRLSNGKNSVEGEDLLLKDSRMFQSIVETLHFLLPDSKTSPQNFSIVDIACFHALTQLSLPSLALKQQVSKFEIITSKNVIFIKVICNSTM